MFVYRNLKQQCEDLSAEFESTKLQLNAQEEVLVSHLTKVTNYKSDEISWKSFTFMLFFSPYSMELNQWKNS